MDYNSSDPQRQPPQPRINRLIKVNNLDITEPIDCKNAVESLGGNRKLFYSMLTRLEVMSVRCSMSQITDSMQRQDWAKMKMAAHSLKSSSGYVGAGKVHYACYYI